MKKVWNVFKRIGGIAADIAPVVAPMIGGPAGTIITTILSAVLAAEKPDVPGDQKREIALRHIAVASPAIIEIIERATGKELVDDAKFQTAMDQLREAVVNLLDSFMILPPKKEAAKPSA